MKKSVKEKELKFPLRGKYVVMLAPSFIVDFEYPKIISQLRELGFEKIVELTFGAKMVNKEYHKILRKSNKLVISSVCSGIVESVKREFPHLVKNLILVDSPMIAMAKVCKKIYPGYKIVFISPCTFKKIEAEKSGLIDSVICYNELKEILKNYKFKLKIKSNLCFDKFYNDYTKIYPVSGGLTKTAHLNGIVNKKNCIIVDGILYVSKFLKNPKKSVKFADVTFCRGGCIGGPCVSSKLDISERRQKVLDYMKKSQCKDIPELKKGLICKAKGISFRAKNI